MKIGQVWKRISPFPSENEMYYPKKGWKVVIVDFSEAWVIHKVIEYNGEYEEISFRMKHTK